MAVRKKRAHFLPTPRPVLLQDYSEAELWALRACYRGEATPQQQKDAIEFLVRRVCATLDLPYRPESQRDTDFALGKMFVGQTIIFLCRDAPSKVDEDQRAARQQQEQEQNPAGG